MSDTPDILNAEQAAVFLGKRIDAVRWLARKGKLPGRKVGKTWLFSRDALVAYVSDLNTQKE